MDNMKEYILSIGADLAGFADLSPTPAENRFGLRYGIAAVIAENPAIIKNIPSGTVIVEYSEEVSRINRKLDEICEAVSRRIQSEGFRAVPQTVDFARKQRDENATDAKPGRVLMPHKTVAALAGLGWITKSALLVTPEYGSAVRLTSVLTDMPLETSLKADYKCLCGDCALCADACPGGAIKNKTWDVHTDRDEMIDFYACRRVTEERGAQYGITGHTCGICVAVCPYTKNP